jgi:peroxiredoxin
VLIATAGVVVVGTGIAVILALRSGAMAPPRSLDAAVAPPPTSLDALAAAADKVGFRPTVASNVGIVENLPANVTLLPPSRTVLPVGSPAPDFSLWTPTGEQVRLSDFRGKTVLLEFFATWCPHCQAEAPHLVKLWESLPPGKFQFLSVNADSEDAASLHAFHRYFGISWPVLLDQGTPVGSFAHAGAIGPVARAYGLRYYPLFYIIDPKGRIAWRNDREQPDGLLLQQLANASAQ